MDFSLSDELLELKERTERFVREKILPYRARSQADAARADRGVAAASSSRSGARPGS